MTKEEIQSEIDKNQFAIDISSQTIATRTAAIAELTAQLNKNDLKEAATATVAIFEQPAEVQVNEKLSLSGFKWWIAGQSYNPLTKTGTAIVAIVTDEVSEKESFDFQVSPDQWTEAGILKLVSGLDIFAKSDTVDLSTIDLSENIKP